MTCASSEAALLEARNLSVRYGGVEALSGMSMVVNPGEVVGVIGPNGAGKSTLIDALTGYARLSSGQIVLGSADVSSAAPHTRQRAGMVRTFQSLELFEDLSVYDNLMVSAEGRLRGAVRKGVRQAAREQVGRAISLLGIDKMAFRMPSQLSHGERLLVAVGRALASDPRILLLDEPAAGLDAGERETLKSVIERLRSDGLAIVLVDHDMSLTLTACDRIYVLNFGRLIAHGTPREIRDDPAVVAAYLGSEGGEAESEVMEELQEHPLVEAHSDSPAAPPETTSNLLLQVEDLVAGYGGFAVVHGVSLTVRKGEVVALVGANGAGKTTTLLTISGIYPPLRGTIEVFGEDVTRQSPQRLAAHGLAHVPEDRSLFFPLTTAENLRLGMSGRSEALPAEFQRVIELFPALGALMSRKSRLLSGGEQQMLAMARALISRPRLLIIDEMSLGLAPLIVEELLPIIRRVADEGDAGVLIVEQHVELGLKIADRVYVMDRGHVVAEGTTAEIRADRQAVEQQYLGSHAGPQ